MKKVLSCYILLCFLITSIMGPNPVYAQDFRLPEPGQMVALSPAFNPAVLKGIKLDPKNSFRFHFFVDSGDSNLSQADLKSESSKLIKYFLASLTIPEKDLWVNLSPYEKDRIVPQEFGQTEMGRDLLAEDYVLKQITASLIYPESQLGKEFWAKVYAKAQAKYGTTNIPVNTFNKVWIVPEKAVVYENGGVAFVLENHLKVMLEQDYLSLKKHTGITSEKEQATDTNQLGSQIVREIVIPTLTKEVNEGKNFSQLRQVFYSLILATWYKKKIKDSVINKVYSNHNKISGVNVSAQDKEKIYQKYLKAFKKGVYNYIKEESDPLTNQTIPRKYFSGGVNAAQISDDMAMVGLNKVSERDFAQLGKLTDVGGDFAMTNQKPVTLADGAMIGKSNPAQNGLDFFEKEFEGFDRSNQALSMLYEHVPKALSSVVDKIERGRLDPYFDINTSDHQVHDPHLKPVSSDRELRIGFYALAADPPHWGHLGPMTFAVDQLNLDMIVWRVQGIIDYKGTPEEHKVGAKTRYEMTKAMIEPFYPLFRMTDVGLNDNSLGEVGSQQFLKKNPNVRINLVYILGSDSEARTRDKIRVLYNSAKAAGINPLHRITIAVTLRGDYGKVLTQDILNKLIREEKADDLISGEIIQSPFTDVNWGSTDVRRSQSYQFVPKVVQAIFKRDGLYGVEPSQTFDVTPDFVKAFDQKIESLTVTGRPGADKDTLMNDFILKMNQLLPQDRRIETVVLGDYFRGIARLVRKQAQAGDQEKYGAYVNLLDQEDISDMLNRKLIKFEKALPVINAILREPRIVNAKHIFFNGLPRNMESWQAVKEGRILLRGKPLRFGLILDLDLPREVTFQRATQRKADALKSGGIPRPDDEPAIIENGQREYDDNTLPMIKALEQLPEFRRVSSYYPKLNSADSIRETRRNIMRVLGDFVQVKTSKVDKAMNSEPGGIDLNPAQMSMQVNKDGQDFKFDFNGTGIDAAHVTGATFTIHTMTPATNLPLILGLIQEPAERIEE